jgi:FlaG protein
MDSTVRRIQGTESVEPIGVDRAASRERFNPGHPYGRPVPGLDEFDRMEVQLGQKLLQAHAQFVVHPKSGVVSIKIIDSQTNQVIREIPSDEVVRIAEELQSYLDAHKQFVQAGGS